VFQLTVSGEVQTQLLIKKERLFPVSPRPCSWSLTGRLIKGQDRIQPAATTVGSSSIILSEGGYYRHLLLLIRDTTNQMGNRERRIQGGHENGPSSKAED